MTGEHRSREDRDEARRRAALRDLARTGEQSELLLSGGVKRAAGVGGEDAIEVWGRRIGRTLSLFALVALVWYLAATYL